MPPDAAVAQVAVGTVGHTRHRPRRHAFRYPATFVRLPMRDLDRALAGQRFFSRNRFNLLSFHDADHGDRRAPLVAWLDALLADAGVDDANGALWLHAFPRVLGYAFKPVSFWFCHRADGALRAVVAEVNNTFGERHCYVLAHADGRPIACGEELVATKVFHVSPFCPVAGRYRFRFVDARGHALARIDYDGADGARVMSTSLSGRLAPMTSRALLVAFARVPLFTFGVVARIHWQALRLWAKRVPYFAKPAPPTIEIPR